MTKFSRLLPALVALTACETGPAAHDVDAYLHDAATRRATLERALWRPELHYSRSLLANYGLGEAGWDLLPALDSRSEPLTVKDTETLAAGQPLTLAAEPLAPATPPTTSDEWQALGEQVFTRLPMRRDAYITFLASRPDLFDAVGLDVDADGAVRGLVKFADRTGDVRVGVTCALCHGGQGIVGRADRRIDLGLARALFAETKGRDATTLRAWGPGRADVTEDGEHDPLAIPDLWGVRYYDWLNSSGSIAVEGTTTLAVRFETQFILGHGMEARPDRTLTWALARFVESLTPPSRTLPESASVAPGAAVFERDCAGCHDPDRGYGGALTPAAPLGVDLTAANSLDRGTGYYKAPSLLRVADNAPYLHDGSVPSLAALLDSGHPFGARSSTEQTHLIAFLETL